MISESSSEQKSFKQKIIINADDYGYSWQRCQGILELIEDKCITSTSVIVNAPEIQEKCRKLVKLCMRDGKGMADEGIKENGKLVVEEINWQQMEGWQVSIGLHLNFTQFHPVSTCNRQQALSIIDPATKTFKGKPFLYSNLTSIVQDQALKQFIHAQTQSQILKFISFFGFRPSHIDGHNHVHIIPGFAEVVCEVSRLFGIYKVRMPTVAKLYQKGDPVLDSYNEKFLKMAAEAKKIYEKLGFLSPDYLIGLDIMGKDFTVSNVERRLSDVTKIRNPLSYGTQVVQIMVHPGYRQVNGFKEFPTCPFSKNSERQLQLKVLKSKQFAKFHPQLCSYHNLIKNQPQKSVIIFSKLLECTGNLTTSLRLEKILSQRQGFRVYFMDVSDSASEKQEVKHLRKMIEDLNVKLVIGVNLTRTAGIIREAVRKVGSKVPYILVVAGTDANITLESGAKDVLYQINESIKQCECLVSISSKMKVKMENYLSTHGINKEIVLIPQSTLNPQGPQLQSLSIPNFSLSKPYIVFPTSFRKVKAVHHILPELNQIIKHFNVNVYILGPIIDEQYYRVTVPKLGQVVYLSCQPHEVYLQILRNSFALINCSESEGMSCSILEAFEERIPVIVRKNQGNCELVSHGINGFIYETGKDFVQRFENLYHNYEEIKQKVCSKARETLHQSFGFQKQCQSYRNLFEKYLDPLLYPLEISSTTEASELSEKMTFHIMSLKNVHPVSPVNLSIFNKFFEKDINDVNPCYKYVGKMLAMSGEDQKVLNILDVGCGNGIFTLFFIFKFMAFFQDYSESIVINLAFLDIHADSLSNLKVNLRTLQQACHSKLNKRFRVERIAILQSNMFEQLGEKFINHFDLVFANMPQTPFKNQKSRLDKNGGEDGFKLTTILIQNYKKCLKDEQSILITLYSHMLDERKYKELLRSNGSKIEWVSEVQVHRIKREDYDKMEERLGYMIQENMRNGKSGIRLEGDVFFVPADLRVIKPE